MLILAHRGDWKRREERNSRAALQRALAQGFGLETDVRDYLGRAVVAHDPPMGSDLIDFDEILTDCAASPGAGPLAINIKADGLQPALAEAIIRHNQLDAFVFDMAVPDALAWLKTGVATFTRQSEFEREPAFYEAAAGVWLDCFERDWIDAEVISGHQANGKRAALVSPELHGRDPEQAWTRWREADHSAVMLCTDRPVQAAQWFGAGA